MNKPTGRLPHPFRFYLGKLKNQTDDGYGPAHVFLTGFNWACGWYWSGGHIEGRHFFCHFNGCFLDTPDIRGHPLGNFVTPWTKKDGTNPVVIENGCSIWADLSVFLDNPQIDPARWWRLKDLYKQFYIYRDAAAAFQYGGHCSATGRSEKEVNPTMASAMNDHIEQVIIPEIKKTLRLA